MIYVIATIQLHQGTREAFLDEFRALIPLVHEEDGCIAYQSAVDLPTTLPAQEAVRDDTVVVVEQWRDIDALGAHLTAPHMNAYRAKVKSMVAGTQLQVLQPA
jgi:quinol monooxygenase YgiN